MEHQSMAQTKPRMTFPNAVKTACLRKYGDFSGRATRAEYWWWVLAVLIGSSIFNAVDSSIARPFPVRTTPPLRRYSAWRSSCRN